MSVSRSRDDSAALGGIVNGYAPLDSGLLIPQSYIPKAGTGAPGAVLLEQHTASASATLDFTTFISSTYDNYQFELINLVPATNSQQLYMRMGTGGGPTYDSTAANYYGSGGGLGSSGASGNWNNAGTTGAHRLTGGNVTNAGSYGLVNATFSLNNPGGASANKVYHGTIGYHNGSEHFTVITGGLWNQNTAVTAVRFLFASGNIASGIIRVYGMPK